MTNLDDNEEISTSNVDRAVHAAIKKYAEENMIVDYLFWSKCIGLLQQKYDFELEPEKQ